MFQEILNLKGHQNCIIDSRVTGILLNRWILPIGGASAVEGLRSTGLSRLYCLCPRIHNNKRVLKWPSPEMTKSRTCHPFKFAEFRTFLSLWVTSSGLCHFRGIPVQDSVVFVILGHRENTTLHYKLSHAQIQSVLRWCLICWTLVTQYTGQRQQTSDLRHGCLCCPLW